MHLSFILLSVFVILFHLAESSPFRERHVLNRVPITIEKQRWAKNQDTKNINHNKNNNDEKKDDENTGTQIENAEKEDAGEISGNNNEVEGDKDLEDGDEPRPITLLKQTVNEKEDNEEQGVPKPKPIKLLRGNVLKPITLLKQTVHQKEDDEKQVPGPKPMKLLRGNVLRPLTLLKQTVNEKEDNEAQGVPGPKPIKLLRGNVPRPLTLLKQTVHETEDIEEQGVPGPKPIKLLRGNVPRPLTLLKQTVNEKDDIEEQGVPGPKPMKLLKGNVLRPLTLLKQTVNEKEDSEQQGVPEPKPIKLLRGNVPRPLTLLKQTVNEKEDNEEQGVPGPKPIKLLKGNVLRPITLLKQTVNEKEDNEEQKVPEPKPIKLLKGNVLRPITLLKQNVNGKEVNEEQGVPGLKPIKLLSSNAGVRKKDKQAVMEINPITLLRDEGPNDEKENVENHPKPITLLKEKAENEKADSNSDDTNVGDRNTDKEDKGETPVIPEAGDGNDEKGDEDGDGGENGSKDIENDAVVGSDDTKDHPIEDQRADSFKKYHAEKISHMQEAMANNWPLGIIPYKFDTSSFDNILALRVRDAMDFLESVSCVQFKALAGSRPDNFSWIHITNPEKERECSHKPKMKNSGEIVLILGLECLKRRDILHSLLHAIGFRDEVTHPHRDQYIRIMWENVQPKYQNLFALQPGDRKVLVEYDPMSIMHFHDRAYSRNGQATIVPLIPGLQIQPSEMLSQLDTRKLRLAYGRECNRQTVDSLLETCKNVMHKESRMVRAGNSQRMTLEGGGSKVNDAEIKKVQDDKEKNETIVRDDYQYEEYDMPGLQIQPSDKLSQLDKMKLRLAFGHECNRREVDDLFDTCKSVMHKQSNDGEDTLKFEKGGDNGSKREIIQPKEKDNSDGNEDHDDKGKKPAKTTEKPSLERPQLPKGGGFIRQSGIN